MIEIPSLGWTHDPLVFPGPLWKRVVRPDGTFIFEYDVGWKAEVVPGDAPRCDAPHPSADYSIGSCGASPDHEHPHMWLQHGYSLAAFTRTTRVRVGV